MDTQNLKCSLDKTYVVKSVSFMRGTEVEMIPLQQTSTKSWKCIISHEIDTEISKHNCIVPS